ncbi:hypothetical protein HOD08_04725 [bacterium]|jgi:hypothetical protein|nr:hypothetical protein [bacterium]
MVMGRKLYTCILAVVIGGFFCEVTAGGQNSKLKEQEPVSVPSVSVRLESFLTHKGMFKLNVEEMWEILDVLKGCIPGLDVLGKIDDSNDKQACDLIKRKIDDVASMISKNKKSPLYDNDRSLAMRLQHDYVNKGLFESIGLYLAEELHKVHAIQRIPIFRREQTERMKQFGAGRWTVAPELLAAVFDEITGDFASSWPLPEPSKVDLRDFINKQMPKACAVTVQTIVHVAWERECEEGEDQE